MGIVDGLVIAAYASLMVGVGVFYSRKNKTADDYLPGGRRMSPIALGLSLFVLFFLALFIPWANAAGAWLGLLTSIVTAVTIACSKDTGLPFTISFVWIILCSLLVGIVVGSIASGVAHCISSEPER